MSEKYKPRPVSGFPELLPEIRMVEQRWLDEIRRAFESFGYVNIETPSVEEVEVLTAKGEVDKEIYAISRLQADDSDKSDTRLALHFDLTVPFARYTAQHFNSLTFPFKRYQIQKSWRGERPQVGRFREFTQCDVDVVAVDQLPLHFDAEMPLIIYDVLKRLGLENESRLHISNRRILDGFLAGLGIAHIVEVKRALDKKDKITREVLVQLLSTEGLDTKQIDKCLSLIEIQSHDASFAEQVRTLGVQHELLDIGLTELQFVMQQLAHLPNGFALADLSIVRGLDYYTGTVYEGRLTSYDDFTSSVIGGGRYDDLAGGFINKKLPGVGISLGLTRLFAKLLKEGRIQPAAKTPTQILVTLPSQELRPAAAAIANQLRTAGYNVELYHSPQKTAKQLEYANRKAIPYVWFVPFDEGGEHQIKNMQSGNQAQADLNNLVLPE